jgi:hypothetical protein
MPWTQVLALLQELFPEAAAPYTLEEITIALQGKYGARITYDRVCYSCRSLTSIPGQHVQPLNPGGVPLLFSANATQRIARYVVRSKLPPESLSCSTQSSPSAEISA